VSCRCVSDRLDVVILGVVRPFMYCSGLFILRSNTSAIPLPPGAPDVTDWSERHFNLKWKEPIDDGGMPITGEPSVFVADASTTFSNFAVGSHWLSSHWLGSLWLGSYCQVSHWQGIQWQGSHWLRSHWLASHCQVSHWQGIHSMAR
jgi:hypothetical protein